MPKGRKINGFRSDSAAYQASVINHCEKEGIDFAIGADLDEAVKRAIKSMREEDWSPSRMGTLVRQCIV